MTLCIASSRPHIRIHANLQGRTALAGVLVWFGAYKPVMVHPFAVDVLQKLDGTKRIEELGDDLDAGPDVLNSIARQLREIGAI